MSVIGAGRPLSAVRREKLFRLHSIINRHQPSPLKRAGRFAPPVARLGTYFNRKTVRQTRTQFPRHVEPSLRQDGWNFPGQTLHPVPDEFFTLCRHAPFEPTLSFGVPT